MACLFAEIQVHDAEPNATFVVLSPALVLKSAYSLLAAGFQRLPVP